MDATHISRFLLGLGRLSAEAGILVVLVLAAQRVFRKQLAPRWRCALWLLLVLRLALPFSFSSVTSIFNLLPDWPRPRVITSEQVAANLPTPVVAEIPMALRNVPVESIPVEMPKVVKRSAPRWPVWIFTVWLTGVALLVGHIVVSSVRLWMRCRKLPPLTDPAVIAALDDCCERLHVQSKPVLLESVEVNSPALHGLMWPCLLLPKGFTARFSAAELQFVFLHELAHLKRRDLLLNWVIAALHVIHWFNPLVWLGFSRWRADREMACDAMALEAAGQGRNKEYGQTILRLLERFTRPVSTPGLVGILEDKRQLRARIGMIAGYMPTKRWPVVALLLATGLAAIGLTDARNESLLTKNLPTTNSTQEKDHDMNITNHIARAAAITLLAAAAPTNAQTWRAESPATVSTAVSADALIGAWVMVGTPDKVAEAPASGGRMKFFTGKSFCVTQAEPKTGVVIYHHGGTYSVNGDEYVEMIKYANPTTMNFIGQTNGHFKIKLEDDTFTLIGTDNPWKEVWKRADTASNLSKTVKGMIGTWVYVGKPGEAGEAPATGAGFKFITASDWCDTQSDPKTGVVVVHHGGTWGFKGKKYVETVKYADPITMNLIGHAFEFNAKLEGDTLTLMGIENPWQEVWQRVK